MGKVILVFKCMQCGASAVGHWPKGCKCLVKVLGKSFRLKQSQGNHGEKAYEGPPGEEISRGSL